jgi:dTDP-4-amino-4,6-dideoxygalactose transaminase
VSIHATSDLAVLGGDPVRSAPFPDAPPVGREEADAVQRVLETGVLSRFLAAWGPDFLGGPEVQALERSWAERFGVPYAVSVNSATSALYAAIQAAGCGPGDEVIVSPYTMAASATCALVSGAVPVFADIDPATLCLDPASIRARLTPRTKAIVVVHLLGCPADMDAIMAIAREHGLVVIEDAAQAPGGTLGGRTIGTIGDVGVFSLNYHKTIHSGEGGVAVTRDARLAERLRLVRNHGEVVTGREGGPDQPDLLGFNYRMTEVEAAIAHVQLGKLDALTEPRIAHAHRLNARLAGLPGLTVPHEPAGARHVYYLYGLRYDAAVTGVPRERVVEAVRAEGIPLAQGYVKPLYLEPYYQERRGSCAFNCPRYEGDVSYGRGLCPVAERLHERELITTNLCHAGLSEADVDDVAAAFEKVFERIDALRG